MQSSSADKGFFQPSPVLENHFYDDTYQRCFKLFLTPSIISATEAEVAALGQEVISDQVFKWIADAERNKPYLKGSGRNAFGQWKGELVTSEGWRQLQALSAAKGIVATGYDSPYGAFSRPLQFLRTHIWDPSSGSVSCPAAMQDGAARLLQLHLSSENSNKLSSEERRVFENAYQHLISRDPEFSWTSGQWMTERSGGSDVSQTETTAVYQPESEQPGVRKFASKQENIPLGPWSINGFKWFSSGTDSNMTILLARTPAGGLSTFLAPMRKHDPNAVTTAGHSNPDGDCPNGIRISRLKDKAGTWPLPTAELALDDMRGWIVGGEGQGIHQISTILNMTRIHTAIGATSGAGRSLDIAKAFARVRNVGAGRGARMLLADSPLHMRTLSGMVAEYRGLMLLTIFTSYILGLSEHPTTKFQIDSNPALFALTPKPHFTAALFRVLPQIAKAYVCKHCVGITYSCMEALGGVGYLNNTEQESLNISRLWRENAVLPIWEGTTNVNSTDFIRALKHPKGGQASLDALEDLVKTASTFTGKGQGLKGFDVAKKWSALRQRITSQSQADLMIYAQDLVWEMAHILILLLLNVDALSDGDVVAQEILDRFLRDKFSVSHDEEKLSTKEKLEMDKAIVFGRAALDVTARL